MNALSVHFRKEVLGGHTHVSVFAGPDEDHRAKCGDLVFRNEEWALFEPFITGVWDAKVEVVVSIRQRERDSLLGFMSDVADKKPTITRGIVDGCICQVCAERGEECEYGAAPGEDECEFCKRGKHVRERAIEDERNKELDLDEAGR